MRAEETQNGWATRNRASEREGVSVCVLRVKQRRHRKSTSSHQQESVRGRADHRQLCRVTKRGPKHRERDREEEESAEEEKD